MAAGSPRTAAGRAMVGDPPQEYEPCAHPDSWFDRTYCACGSMHDVCTVCYHAIGCPLNTLEARTTQWQADADAILAIEAEARAEVGELDRAWAVVEAALPEGAGIWMSRYHDSETTMVYQVSGQLPNSPIGDGPTFAAALHELARRLSERTEP